MSLDSILTSWYHMILVTQVPSSLNFGSLLWKTERSVWGLLGLLHNRSMISWFSAFHKPFSNESQWSCKNLELWHSVRLCAIAMISLIERDSQRKQDSLINTTTNHQRPEHSQAITLPSPDLADLLSTSPCLSLGFFICSVRTVVPVSAALYYKAQNTWDNYAKCFGWYSVSCKLKMMPSLLLI